MTSFSRGTQGPSTSGSSNEGHGLQAAVQPPRVTLSPSVITNSSHEEDTYEYTGEEQKKIEELDAFISW